MQADKSYDKRLFIQPANNHLECPICFDIMKDPVLCTAQGHTFCRHCVTKHLDRSETCPTCREIMQKDKLLPNRLVCSLIEDAEVHCFSSEFIEEDRIEGKKRKRTVSDGNCEWTGKLKDAEAHYNQCQFAQINCHHDGCDEIVVRKDLPGHMLECIHRPIVCEWCGKVKRTDSIDLHLQECTNRPTPCQNNCLDVKGEVSRFLPSEMDHHRTICAMEIVGCAFAESGCNVRLQRKDMPLHEKDAGSHMVCFLGALQTAQKKVTDLEKAVTKQNEKITFLEEALKSHGDVINRLDNRKQVILKVPISKLDKTNRSENVNISGYDFTVHLYPNTENPGWQRLDLFLLGASNVNLSRVVKVVACVVYKEESGEISSFLHKYVSPEGWGLHNFFQTTDLQKLSINGHISIKVNITLL